MRTKPIIVGVDEVGRGCWAGPLVASAVILGEPITGLKDSKKLTKTERERLAAEIETSAQAFGLGWAEPALIDHLGVTSAIRLAVEQALTAITIPYDEIIIDGNYNFLARNPLAEALIKADDSVPAVSAASIIAKVARDRFMTQAALEYPGYGFERHVGYGTALHQQALQQLGICGLHRRSYKPIQAILSGVVT